MTNVAQISDAMQKTLPNFGKNEGYWEYKTIDGKIFCYTARYEFIKENGEIGKKVTPWTWQNNKWVNKWIDGQKKPIFNLHLLSKYPEKPILLVEGEKTATAAMELFPEFNVMTWMGGSGSNVSVDWSPIYNKVVYMFPDNDAPGFKAAASIKELLLPHVLSFHLVPIERLGLRPKWDVADLDEGAIDFVDIYNLVLSAPKINPLSINIDEIDLYSYPDLSKSRKPRPLDTAANIKYLLDHKNIIYRWNMMSRTREVNVPNINFYSEERENASLNYITDLAIKNGLPHKRIDKHLDYLSWENIYHPIREWILSKEFTQKGIFNEFLKIFKTTDDEMSFILLKRWMLSAIYAVFNDSDFCAQGVLVIQGAPATHKSSFIMSLVPKEMRAIKGGLSLDPSKKDDVFTSSEYWIAELGELDATFRKADIARLKSHITNDLDDVRRPHAVRNSKMIRRTVYAATVNESHFLIDTTGNRRWWTISITAPINTRHGLDMQQIWRYMYELYLQGESPNLTKDELIALNKINENYELLDPFQEKLMTNYNWDWEPSRWLNASQILQEMGYDKPSKSDLKRMGDILTKQDTLQKGTGRLRYSYYMPKQKFYTDL